MQEYYNFLSNHLWLTVGLIVVFILLTIVELIRIKRARKAISPQMAVQLINHHNAVVIDTRSQDAYQKGHILDSHFISLSELKNLKKIEKFREKPIIVICHNGMESIKIAEFLINNGYKGYALAGGIRSWFDAQMPIVKSS